MKIAALTQKEWLGMLIHGSWMPAMLIAIVGCILHYNATLLALAFGFFLQGVIVLGDGWWTIKMQPDAALMWLFASWISRMSLSILSLFAALNSGLALGPLGLGYVLSMAYCLYRKTQLQLSSGGRGEICHTP